MTRTGKSHARRHWIRWTAGIVAALAALVAIGFWAATSRPSWYQPLTVKAEEYPAIRNEVPNFGNEIGRHLKEGQPFRISLPQDEVNRWLAARGEIWPGLQDAFPKCLVDPVVSFEPGRIVLAVRYENGGVSSVLSAAVNLRMEENRGAIRVRIDSLRAGYLPIPRTLVDGQARKALDRQASKHLNSLVKHLWSQTGDYLPAAEAGRQPTVEHLPLASFLGDIWEFRLPTRSRWPNGGFLYSISDLRIENGKVMIDVMPTPRQATRPSEATRPDA
jgi:hypothetical protein